MSSFSAIFKLDDTEYNVLAYSFSMGQATDYKGRPASDVKSGLITLTLTVPQDSNAGKAIMHWMLDAYGPKNGSITFKRIDQDSALRTISFEEGYCVSLSETFGSGSSSSMTLHIGISAKKITAGDATHEKKW